MSLYPRMTPAPIRLRRLPALAGAAMLGLALSGCALLKEPDPVQSYTFGRSVGAEAAPAAPTAALTAPGVLKAPTSFPRAEAGDQVLAVTGGAETAYIAGVRWISPAAVLFDEAVTRAFDRSAVRLLQRGQVGDTVASLRIEVRSFELRYAAPGAAPTAVVEAQATLSRTSDRTVIAERDFAVTRPAGENRVSALVPALDAAASQTVTEIAAWTVQQVSTLPAETPRTPAPTPQPRPLTR